jgi:hypothetical protein
MNWNDLRHPDKLAIVNNLSALRRESLTTFRNKKGSKKSSTKRRRKIDTIKFENPELNKIFHDAPESFKKWLLEK